MVLSYINMNPPQNTCVPHLKTWHISCFTSKERLESSETYAKSYGVFFSWNHLGIPKGGLLSSVSLGRNYTALVLAISEPILLSFVFCITKLLTLWSFTFFLWSFEVRPCPGVEAGFLISTLCLSHCSWHSSSYQEITASLIQTLIEKPKVSHSLTASGSVTQLHQHRRELGK